MLISWCTSLLDQTDHIRMEASVHAHSIKFSFLVKGHVHGKASYRMQLPFFSTMTGLEEMVQLSRQTNLGTWTV